MNLKLEVLRRPNEQSVEWRCCGPDNWGSIPCRGKIFFSSPDFPTRSETQWRLLSGSEEDGSWSWPLGCVCSRHCYWVKKCPHFTLFLHGVHKEKFIAVLGDSVRAPYRQHYKHCKWNNDDNNHEQGDNVAIYGICSKTSFLPVWSRVKLSICVTCCDIQRPCTLLHGSL